MHIHSHATASNLASEMEPKPHRGLVSSIEERQDSWSPAYRLPKDVGFLDVYLAAAERFSLQHIEGRQDSVPRLRVRGLVGSIEV